jgi:cation:H+ antiporter
VFVLLLQFSLLAAVIVVAGMFLTRSADAIGEHSGLGRTLAGMVLLAIGTSLPELTIGTQAARNNAPDLAVGDLLGATLFNLLTLSVLDLIHKSRRQMLSKMAAAHAISAVMGITLIGVVAGAIFFQSQLTNKMAWLGQDPGTWAVFAAYVMLLRLIYFDQQYMLEHLPAGEAAPEQLYAGFPLRRALPIFLAAAAAIFVAAPWMAHVCEEIAEQSGLGQSFVGTTLLAMATTLPEFITTVTAVRM